MLPVRDEESAAQMAIQLRTEFKHSAVSYENKPVYSVADCVGKFIETKKNPGKNKKPLSKATIDDYELHLSHLRYALLEKKINTLVLKAENIDNSIANIMFKYLQGQFDSEVTHKKYFNTYETFCNFIIKEEGIQIKNPFNGWHFAKKESDNEVIYQKEFADLKTYIDTKPTHFVEESGYNRKMYYPWLWDGFRLALFTGARRQEVPVIKWTNIVPNKYTNKLAGGFVLLEDIKVTSIKKLDKVKIKPIEINEDLADLLDELGYEKMKGQDKFIIDPDQNYKRDFIKEYLSKSFAYYIKFASKRSLSFGCLRKTWFTALAVSIGEEGASMMGGHSSKDVTLKHYINEIETAGTRGKFKRIFLPPIPPSGKVRNGKINVSD